MKFTIRNDLFNKFIKVINVCDLRIEQTGSRAELGIGDTRQWYIIYTTCEKPFKENKIVYDPDYDHFQIITDKK